MARTAGLAAVVVAASGAGVAVVRRVNFAAELADGVAIDGDAPFQNDLLARAA